MLLSVIVPAYGRSANVFHTWFIRLELAYCLSGLKEVSAGLCYGWNFKRALGHQFLWE